MKLNESLENSLDFRLNKDNYENTSYIFDLKESFGLDLYIEVFFKFLTFGTYGVDFYTYGENKDLSFEKRASFAIFSTIVQILNDFVKNKSVTNLQANGDSKTKSDIYEKLFQRFAEGWAVKRQGNILSAAKTGKNET
jgi:hypothetical protein